MVFTALINISLDITANVSWWIVKKTLYGTYYLTTYFIYSSPKPTKEEIELQELRKEINLLNRKLHNIDSINNTKIIDKNILDKDLEFVLIDDTQL